MYNAADFVRFCAAKMYTVPNLDALDASRTIQVNYFNQSKMNPHIHDHLCKLSLCNWPIRNGSANQK